MLCNVIVFGTLGLGASMKTGTKGSILLLSSLCATFSVLFSLPVEEKEDGWVHVCQRGMMKIEQHEDLGSGKSS